MSIHGARGWSCVGVILSVLWLITFWSLAYLASTNKENSWLYHEVSIYTKATPCCRGVMLIPPKRVIRPVPLFVGAFGPIAVGWLSVTCTVLALGRVSKGFRPVEGHSEGQ